MSRDIWNPAQYGRFSDERSRPFFELVDRVRAEKPAYVVDLGCGSGELTGALAERWPSAKVEGFDSSVSMIETARGRGLPVEFGVSDVREWRPSGPVDVLVSNAVLQWVPGHHDLLAEWVGALASGGWLAFQVPGNFDAPSHRIIRDLCLDGRWRDRLARTVRPAPVSEPAEYLRLLVGLGCEVDAWETTYLQVLPGDDPVLEWIKGTALRPVLDALPDEEERAAFLAECGVRLREAYPRQPYGTVFPFRRIFVVARKPIS